MTVVAPSALRPIDYVVALDWPARRVATFNGQHDTHIGTGEDYTSVTLGDVFAMAPTAVDKRCSPAFLPSAYCGHDAREHARQRAMGSFVALTGDVDSGNHALDQIEDLVCAFAGDSAWLIYSSAHARPGDMRWRIIIPLATPLPFNDWHDAQLAFFAHMEATGVATDHSLARAAQPVYLPNVPAIHAKSGTALRSADGSAIHYQRASSSVAAPGLRTDSGAVAEGVAAIRQKRAEDERERQRIRRLAEQRRANRPANDDNIIDAFNATNDVAAMLAACGYEQSPRDGRDWHSPMQAGETFATRVIEGKWVSLSASDVGAGVGTACASGCYGDAYDLFVHFKHGGDHKAAFRQLYHERGDNGTNVIRGRFLAEPPPIDASDPGWQGMPEWANQTPDDVAAPAAIEVASASEPFECPPADLWARYEPPALPTGLLPTVIERFALTHGETMGADAAGLAMAALTTCAAAISDGIRLQVKRHDPSWTEAARLWVGLIGTPSTKKTPIMSAAQRPLVKIDADLFAEYVASKEAYDSLDTKERKVAPRPIQRRVRISDATVEAVQEVLKDSPDGVLSTQDELSGWFGSMDKYGAGKGAMADRGFWLQAFNGGSYALNRVARGASLIPNLSINILGGIQPDPLRRIVSDSVDDGLIQRLIPVLLKPATLGEDEPQDESVRRYEQLVRSLWHLKPTKVIGGEGLLHFSEDGQSVRRRLEARHLEMVGTEIISPKLGAHFGKYDGIFARLCVLWHCIEHIDTHRLPDLVSGETAERVAAFLHQYIVPSAVAFYTGTLGLSDDHDRLIELASFILAHRLETVQHRDCQRATATLKALTAEDTKRLFEKLESFAWVESTEPAVKSRTPRWRVNPAVHDLFADRGRTEKARRDAARAAIASVLPGKER
jgi:hypothetical protein